MPLDQNIIIALAGNPVALTAYIESQTVVPVTPAVGVPVPEPVPAPITQAPVAPAVVPVPAVVAPVAPAPAVPVVPGVPLVIEIPMGNRADKAKGFSQFEDMRNLGDFDYLKGDTRIGKVYVPPAMLVGRQGIVTMTITIA